MKTIVLFVLCLSACMFSEHSGTSDVPDAQGEDVHLVIVPGDTADASADAATTPEDVAPIEDVTPDAAPGDDTVDAAVVDDAMDMAPTDPDVITAVDSGPADAGDPDAIDCGFRMGNCGGTCVTAMVSSAYCGTYCSHVNCGSEPCGTNLGGSPVCCTLVGDYEVDSSWTTSPSRCPPGVCPGGRCNSAATGINTVTVFCCE